MRLLQEQLARGIEVTPLPPLPSMCSARCRGARLTQSCQRFAGSHMLYDAGRAALLQQLLVLVLAVSPASCC
jgi:hypothetical protein